MRLLVGEQAVSQQKFAEQLRNVFPGAAKNYCFGNAQLA